MRRLICVLPLLIGGVLNVGCGMPEGTIKANPRREMRFNPFTGEVTVYSNSNDKMSVKGLKAKTKEGGELSAEEAGFEADSAIVRDVDGRVQIPAATEYNRVYMQGLNDGLERWLPGGLPGLAGSVLGTNGLQGLALARGQAGLMQGLSRPNIGFAGPGGVGFNSGISPDQIQLISSFLAAQQQANQVGEFLTPTQRKAVSGVLETVSAEEKERQKQERIEAARKELEDAEAATRPAQ